MGSFGWLHLTDLHRGMTFQTCLWPNIEHEFFRDLESLHAKCGPWDFILWSGDLVQKGAVGEFKKFTETLGRLYSRLNSFGSDPVLITVPGNHDLTRPDPMDAAAERLGMWDEDREVASEFWGAARSATHVLVKAAFRNYMAWEKQHPFPRPTFVRRGRVPGDCAATLDVRGTKIGILGLNSTFLQLTEGDYQGKLAIATEQLIPMCGENFTDWFERHQACFLMTHHPPNWLNESARHALIGEISVPGRFVGHACGHLHEPLMVGRTLGGAPHQRTWQGASLFGLEAIVGGLKRQHGYSAGRIEIVDGVGRVRIWPRVAQKHQAGHWHFVRDTSATLESDDGTQAEECPLNRFPRASLVEKSVFRVLVISTDLDLQEARRSAALHLKKSLGVEVDESLGRSGTKYDLAILIQGWRWEGGVAVRNWEAAPTSNRIAFLVRDDSDWPPLRLAEVGAHQEIMKFRLGVDRAQDFQRPDQIPELVGAVVTESLRQQSGDTVAGLTEFERSYLEFRIPVWRSGRTALSQPHLFDAADAKELYQPDLYTTLHGVSTEWRVDKGGRPMKARPKKKRHSGIQVGDGDRRVQLAKWITVPGMSRIALIGAPGGGKTIFLTRIAAAVGSACLGRPVEFDPDLEIEKLRRENGLPIPIVIEATRIAQRDPSSVSALLGAIGDELTSAGTYRPGLSEIEARLKCGRYFVLVDALDEIADASSRSGVLHLLKGIASVYPQARVLLTTRSARYTGQLKFGPEYESVEIAPLDERQVQRLCGNWARHRQRDEEYRALLMTAVNGLADKVSRAASDQALIENPLMLTAICMVFERYRSLPDDRGRLCETLIDDLCRSRRSEDTLKGWRLDETGKKDLLQRIAFAMQEEGAQAWPFDRAVEIALQLVPTTDHARRERARKYVDWAADHTGILRFLEARGEQEQIRFWHRLFREYLCATRLAQEDTTAGNKIDKLWGAGRISDPFWEDVIRLLPRALGTIEKARSLREGLEGLATRYQGQRGRLLGLSAAGIIENRDLFPDVNFWETASAMAATYEQESDAWPLPDRLLFLDALGRLDPNTYDPRMNAERWVEPRPGAGRPFIVHFDIQRKPVDFAFAWAPVTVQQYWQFVRSNAFMDDACWKDAPPAVLESRPELAMNVQSQLRHPNWPVIWVSLYAALAYCSWKTLTRGDGKHVRLPLTVEWKKLILCSPTAKDLAAADGWPTGEKATLNWAGASVGHPTPVGAFALKICGASDVLGNVWEWLLPSKGDSMHQFVEDGERKRSCPVGGIAYNSGPGVHARSNRFIAAPPPNLVTDGYESIGFRCVISDTGVDVEGALSQGDFRRRRSASK